MNLLADHHDDDGWYYALQHGRNRIDCSQSVTRALLEGNRLIYKLQGFFPIAPEVLVKWM